MSNAPTDSSPTNPAPIPALSGAEDDLGLGHLLEMREAPIELFQRIKDECGEVGECDWAGTKVVMLSGPEAQEAFFRAPDSQLDQGAAYPFMKPIFGEGVVFDLPVEQRKSTLRTQALKDEHMRGHAEVIARETEAMCDRLGEEGEIDLLDFFGELTTYTSTATLIGQEFRDDLAKKGNEFAQAFQGVERGTDAFAYVNPYMNLPSFRDRDAAREQLVELITDILDTREEEERRCRDLLAVMDSLIEPNGDKKFSRSEITGMIIGMMLAGHHTSQGAAAWTLIELLRNPDANKKIVEELDAIYADGRQVSFQSLREIPLLEGALKETLRMHPPLIILMRKVMKDFNYKNYTIEEGKLVAVSPATSNRDPDYFPNPNSYDIERYLGDRREDARNPWAWIPFGGGRHKCVGSAFALMQLKGIFSILLRHYEFEAAQPDHTYANDHSKMVVHLKQPCRVRYKRRQNVTVDSATASALKAREEEEAAARPFRVIVDKDLCQGHAVCTGEAPEVFELGEDGEVQLSQEEPRRELRRKVEQAAQYCPNHVIRIEDL